MRYVIENVNFKAGMFTSAPNLVPDKVQPMLDTGTAKGWRLHTMFPTLSDKAINIVIVWEID